MKLTKEEMLKALAEGIILNATDGCSELFNDMGYYEEDLDELEVETIVEELEEVCGEIGYCKFKNESSNYSIEIAESRGGEGDGAQMFCTIKFTRKSDNIVGYLEFSGRYSSWDSSSYDSCYVVEPEEVVVTKYKRV